MMLHTLKILVWYGVNQCQGLRINTQDAKNKDVEHILILSGDHLYRMDYMDFVQVRMG